VTWDCRSVFISSPTIDAVWPLEHGCRSMMAAPCSPSTPCHHSCPPATSPDHSLCTSVDYYRTSQLNPMSTHRSQTTVRMSLCRCSTCTDAAADSDSSVYTWLSGLSTVYCDSMNNFPGHNFLGGMNTKSLTEVVKMSLTSNRRR